MENVEKIEFRENLKIRLRQFVLDLIRLCKSLPREDDAIILKKQLLRSGSSVYANYRAANRARSKAEFFSKLSIVVEEADETLFWIEMFIDGGFIVEEKLFELRNESEEILKLMSSYRSKLKPTNH